MRLRFKILSGFLILSLMLLLNSGKLFQTAVETSDEFARFSSAINDLA